MEWNQLETGRLWVRVNQDCDSGNEKKDLDGRNCRTAHGMDHQEIDLGGLPWWCSG